MRREDGQYLEKKSTTKEKSDEGLKENNALFFMHCYHPLDFSYKSNL